MSNTIRGISIKIVLAAASGYCCCLVFLKGSDSLLTRVLMGLTFAGGVLFPYLQRDRFLLFRAFGLIVVSSISFESAVFFGLPVGNPTGYWPDLEAFMAASLVGAAIALFGARLLIPLKNSIELLVTGLVAAVLGGFGFVLAGLERPCIAFVLWHSLMALAIHVAEGWPLSWRRIR
jgi:hypothetical protein